MCIPQENKDILLTYLHTSYFVYTENETLCIRINNKHPKIDALLFKSNAKTWAFISAYNPFPSKLTDDDNLSRHRLLRNKIINLGFYFYDGAGIGDDKSWESEQSFFVLGISEETAVSIAKKFKQLAMVFGSIDEPAKLIFCNR